MAPLLNSRTASKFNTHFTDIPSDIKGIRYYLCSFTFFVIFCYCSILLYFVLTPLLPHYHPTVKLNSVTVNSLDTKAVNLTAKFDMTFVFKYFKKNDRTVTYNDIEVKVWWSGKDTITLAEVRLSPFTERNYSMTDVGVILKVVDGFSNGSDVVKGIDAEWRCGSVNFGVSVFGSVQFGDGSSENLRFEFNPVVVVFAPGSKSGSWKANLMLPRRILHRDLNYSV